MVTSIKLVEPGELISAIPGLLNFTPSESVVVVAFAGNEALTLRATIRIDLAQLMNPATAVEQLRTFMTTQRISSLVTVVVGGTGDTCPDPTVQDPAITVQPGVSLDLPHHAFVAQLQRMAETLAVETHPLWVERIEHRRTWRCYNDVGCTGTLPDPRISPVAVALVAAGEVAYTSRDDLAAQLVDPPDDLQRRTVLLRNLTPLPVPEAMALLRDAVGQISDPTGLMFDDDTVVRLAHAMTHQAVRDAGLALVLAKTEAAQRLWFVLTRTTPRPQATHPATLLAVSAALRGNGALANIALDIALAADPNNRMASLLTAALAQGITPDQLRYLLAGSLATTPGPEGDVS